MIPGRLRPGGPQVAPTVPSSPNAEAARFSVLVAASRATGFVRMLAGFAVLGTSTQLGNVVQSANLVPTLLFELLAAGALGAVFIPMLVDEERRFAGVAGEFRSRLAGTVLVYLGGALALVVVVALAARSGLSDYLLGNVAPGDRRQAQLLSTYLLWWFLPQVFAYLANAVAVALLNARGRFWAGAVCPLVNNVVVSVSLGALALLRAGDVSLPLSDGEKLLIGGGFTAGVVAMAAVPLWDAVGHAAPIGRPLPPRSDELGRLARAAWWAVLFLAPAQVPMLAILPLTNSVDGHTQVWILTWQILLLPHALLASPIYTTRPPPCRRPINVDAEAFGELAGSSVRSVLTTGALSGVLLAALSPQVAQAVSIGAAADSTGAVAAAVAGLRSGSRPTRCG
ncbi:MAG: lipid II flippase MurJ [Microthrixaceae bacterium]